MIAMLFFIKNDGKWEICKRYGRLIQKRNQFVIYFKFFLNN